MKPELEKKFQEIFESDFGIKVYVVPVIILIAAGGIVLFFGFTGGIGLALNLATSAPSPVQPFGITLDVVSIAAIFGAYTWITSDVIVRNHLWTLHPSDLTWYALRFIVAIPLGQALAVTVDKVSGGAIPVGAGAFLAFAANMFSLDAINNTFGAVATRFGLPVVTNSDERDDLIVKLAGVDEEKARALNVEGVSTIAQLTTVDPIRTSIRSGLPFEFVLNLIDAALLWTSCGDAMKSLRMLGLRGASDVLALEEAWQKQADDALTAALAALRQADAAVGQAETDLEAAELTPAAAQAQQAVTTATSKRAQALGAFLALSRTPPGLAVDRPAMLAALTTKAVDGGPGLTEVGFDTIAARLRANSYAVFVKKLLES